jgi:glutathione peroxidase
MTASLYDFAVRSIDGQMRSIADFRGKVLLIVNVASECGYTPQYKGLEALYRQYHERGLVVLGFPCDQFGHQEPGAEAEIVTFCETRFGVTFPLFAKIDVNGASADPLYRHLKTAKPGLLGTERIKWNFTKFLVDRHGNVVERFGSADTPEKIEPKIRALVDR